MAEANGARIMRRVTLGLTHRMTGNARHYLTDQPLSRPFALMIVAFGPREYNLIHLDKAGREMTDTFHESIEDAYSQAEFEFLVKPEDWSIVEEAY